jgi:hypothetical protein
MPKMWLQRAGEPHHVWFTFIDDFELAPVDANLKWTEIDDGATGTIVASDELGGWATIPTANVDNDYHAISSPQKLFDVSSAKELWFECRFRITENQVNESTWWFGLTDTLTTGGMQADTAGPLASYDGILIWTQEGDLAILSETSNAGTQNTNTTMGNYVSGQNTRLAFYVNDAATTAVVTFYHDLTDSGSFTAFATTQNLTRAGLEAMHVVAGVKAGPSATIEGPETLEIDYIRCVQTR